MTMCEFHESTCNGLGDIWWTDNPIYFSSIDYHQMGLQPHSRLKSHLRYAKVVRKFTCITNDYEAMGKIHNGENIQKSVLKRCL